MTAPVDHDAGIGKELTVEAELVEVLNSQPIHRPSFAGASWERTH